MITVLLIKLNLNYSYFTNTRWQHSLLESAWAFEYKHQGPNPGLVITNLGKLLSFSCFLNSKIELVILLCQEIDIIFFSHLCILPFNIRELFPLWVWAGDLINLEMTSVLHRRHGAGHLPVRFPAPVFDSVASDITEALTLCPAFRQHVQ